MRNNGSIAAPVIPIDISATVIPRPISVLNSVLIIVPPLLIMCSVYIIPDKYFISFTEPLAIIKNI